MKTFGEFIRDLREQHNIPQRKVAEALDIDVSVLSRIESSNRFPKRNIEAIVSRLAILFNKTEEELMKNYMSDEIAYKLLDCENVDQIMEDAKVKINYIKSKNMVQSTLKFDK